jgi:hypothetical protein
MGRSWLLHLHLPVENDELVLAVLSIFDQAEAMWKSQRDVMNPNSEPSRVSIGPILGLVGRKAGTGALPERRPHSLQPNRMDKQVSDDREPQRDQRAGDGNAGVHRQLENLVHHPPWRRGWSAHRGSPECRSFDDGQLGLLLLNHGLQAVDASGVSSGQLSVVLISMTECSSARIVRPPSSSCCMGVIL